MILRILGSRGLSAPPTAGHARHSALLIEAGPERLMIDCGSDWLGAMNQLRPTALLLTHAHLDHAGGLVEQMPCPVWASATTWGVLAANGQADIPGDQHRTFGAAAFCCGPLQLTGVPVHHSWRSPAVGFRITDGKQQIGYFSDLAALVAGPQALAGLDLYLGDGSCFHHSLMRLERGLPCGHAPIPEQLAWCARAAVPRALFTHLGAELLADKTRFAVELAELGEKLGIRTGFVCDGQQIELAG